MHVALGENAPLPLADSVTLPVGAVGLAAVSVTVTAQLVGCETTTRPGVQLTPVVVGSRPTPVTVTGVVALLCA